MVGVADADFEQAVGVTREPLLSKGANPKQPEYSEAHVARFVPGAPRQVLYLLEQSLAQVFGVVDPVAVAGADLEHAVGVTNDPLSLKGEYPRHPAYSEAHRDRLAFGELLHVLYEVAQASEQAFLLRLSGDA